VTAPDGPLLGSWARGGGVVGVVAAVQGAEAVIFDPGDRRVARVALGDLEPLPTGAVRVTLSTDLPVPHGVGEDLLRRWVATLTDQVLHERAAAALIDAGLDAGAALPAVRFEVVAADPGAAVCLCGISTPAADGTMIRCPACGRQAAAPPAARS
jgi:hypothetical protein